MNSLEVLCIIAKYLDLGGALQVIPDDDGHFLEHSLLAIAPPKIKAHHSTTAEQMSSRYSSAVLHLLPTVLQLIIGELRGGGGKITHGRS